MSVFSRLFGAIWDAIKSLFESTKDAFNNLPADEQQAILNGTKVAQIIKDNITRGETYVIDVVAIQCGISIDDATDLFQTLAKDLKLDQVVSGVAERIESGITDIAHSSLFQSIAQFAASYLSGGKVSWITLALGVIEYAYQYLKANNEFPVVQNSGAVTAAQAPGGDPLPRDPTHPPKP